jgi:hypothetical protein
MGPCVVLAEKLGMVAPSLILMYRVLPALYQLPLTAVWNWLMSASRWARFIYKPTKQLRHLSHAASCSAVWMCVVIHTLHITRNCTTCPSEIRFSVHSYSSKSCYCTLTISLLCFFQQKYEPLVYGFNCLRIGTGGGLLWSRWWTFRFWRPEFVSLLPRSLMSTAEKPMKIVSLLVKVREHVFFHWRCQEYSEAWEKCAFRRELKVLRRGRTEWDMQTSVLCWQC